MVYCRQMLRLLAIAILIPIFGINADDLKKDLSGAWKKTPSGLEIFQTNLGGSYLLSSSITLVRAPLSSFRPTVIRANQFGLKRASVKMLCRSAKAVGCINANFFDEQGKPLGLVINRGVIYQKLQKGGDTLTGIVTVSPIDVKIIHRDEFNPSRVIEAIQAGPRLIADKLPVSGLHESIFATDLSGFCIDNSKRIILFRLSAGLFGASLTDLQTFLLSPQIACKDAINFDGGGSSQLFVKGEADFSNEIDIAGNDLVPVALGLLPKFK